MIKRINHGRTDKPHDAGELYKLGFQAADFGLPPESNPISPSDPARTIWDDGFNDGRRADSLRRGLDGSRL